MPEPSQILRPSNVARLLGVSRTTLWRWTKAGHLPPPIKLGPGVTGWRASDIDAWVASRSDPASGG